MKKNRRFYVLVLLALFALLISGCDWFDDDDDDSNVAGSLDTSFGEGGKVVTNLEGYGEACAVALQSDGKIVAAGYIETAPLMGAGALASKSVSAEFAIIRYNVDGTFDDTFGEGGIVTTDVGEGNSSEAYGVAIQTIGDEEKIVVVGRAYNGSDDDIALVRYNDDGTLDDTFGDGGIVITDIDGYYEEANAVVIDGDSNIVIAGYTGSDTTNDFAVLRYLDDGDLDIAFGEGGVVITPFNTNNSYGNAIAIQPSDGMIVVAGEADNGDYDVFALARYETDGTLDDTFGEGGQVGTSFSAADYGAYAMALQEDGKIVAGGYRYDGEVDSIALARYDTDGDLDATFGDGGVVTLIDEDVDSEINGLAIQEDGKIVVAGYTEMDNGSTRFAIGRLDTDGSFDRSFGSNGYVTTSFTGDDDGADAVVIDPSDGGIIAVGWAYDGTYDNFAVARYLP